MSDTHTCAYLLLLISCALFGWHVLGPLFYVLREELPGWANRQLDEWARWRRSRDYMAIYRYALRHPIDLHYAMRRLTVQTAYAATAFRSIGLSADEAMKSFQQLTNALSHSVPRQP